MNTKRKYSLNESVFENIDTEEKAYWLGFLLADGCIVTGRHFSIQVDVSTKDIELLNKFLSFIQSNALIYNSKNICNGKIIWSKRIKINSKKIVNDLVQLGVSSHKSFTTRYINTKFDRDFIRGIFDGDGTISKGKDSNCFAIYGTKSLTKSIRNKICNKLDIKSNKIWNANNMYGVRWRSYNDIQKLYDYLYKNSNIYLSRKKNKFLEILGG